MLNNTLNELRACLSAHNAHSGRMDRARNLCDQARRELRESGIKFRIMRWLKRRR